MDSILMIKDIGVYEEKTKKLWYLVKIEYCGRFYSIW